MPINPPWLAARLSTSASRGQVCTWARSAASAATGWPANSDRKTSIWLRSRVETPSASDEAVARSARIASNLPASCDARARPI